MKIFTRFVAVLGLVAFGPVMAAEDPTWGAWNSADDDALAQIVLGEDYRERAGNPSLGPDDATAFDAGFLLSDLIGQVLDDAGISLGDLLNGGTGALNDVLAAIPVDAPVDLGGVVDDAVTDVCGAIPAC